MVKKDTFYFPHDYTARSDPKIVKLLMNEGWEGYGLFWGLVEYIYSQNGTLEYDLKSIAFELRTESERIESIIKKYDLFKVNDNNKLFSDSINRRLLERKKKSKKAKESAMARWSKKSGGANALQSVSDSNAKKEIKRKEIKEKEINIPFETFWDLYDKKVGSKDKVKNKWEKLKDEDRIRIIDYIPKYKISQPNKKYRKNAESFFNNRGWEDELIEDQTNLFNQEEQNMPEYMIRAREKYNVQQ